jgi:SAM-dependent methyltransferase
MQVTLNPNQLKAFYHDEFVASQIKHFTQLLDKRSTCSGVVVDVGGGVGYFGSALKQIRPGVKIRVVDMDARSVQQSRERGIMAVQGDALKPPVQGDEDVICFNLILHHLIGTDECSTLNMQSRALLAWRGHAEWLFVDEYIYDSYLGNLSGKLIYLITRSNILSSIGKMVSKVVPSLNANTFGVGVRFRSEHEWRGIFEKIGFHVEASIRGPEEHVSLARRMLLIRSCRRDSFLLKAA